jgi:hypothetical protein
MEQIIDVLKITGAAFRHLRKSFLISAWKQSMEMMIAIKKVVQNGAYRR